MISFGAMLHHFCEWRKQEEYHDTVSHINFASRMLKQSNPYNPFQIPGPKIGDKIMQKMTREKAINKLSMVENGIEARENILNALEALGLIEFEKEKEYINLISNNNYYQFTFKEMQDALANYDYQIVKKREQIINGPVLVYLSELSRNVSFKCLKDALACYGLIVVKSTNECGKPSVDLEPPGL